MTITVRDRAGGITRQISLPRKTFVNVEQTLQSMHARVVEKLRDKQNLCRDREDDIVLP